VAVAIMNAMPQGLFLLNAQRRIVFANRAAVEFAGRPSAARVIGQHLGEVLDCVHAGTSGGRCGTHEGCRRCGWAPGLAASDAARGSRDCHLTRRFKGGEQCVDLQVRSTPIRLGGHRCTLLIIVDVSAEQRRLALERMFFHDAIELASGAEGILQSLTALAPAELRDYFQLAHEAVRQLLDETQTQRDLLAVGRKAPDVSTASPGSRELLPDLDLQAQGVHGGG